ncbi:FKBP-type peptidylprolyl cis-trans isomerase [Dictyostelium discoideum AX4]|uniref:FK506-binding protein 3 n=1 Tax=Dictyostelium discoideum TaxID=44689 RepID=FKBP3_DICDI|nr:FKBP-type peptidylprolyl cis-trans isomerase [Dictyostelium discoideum AX4]Q54N80.1 RecName: Full=FK506-binding protein 3; AltName: Full=Peptidyl-prolyl cis-trans isomerase; Short=PPIase; AltName: Full=Rotamase; Flags: Precursor [Dictyostelium discoideum]EAL64565.1 FKBP-type peptidylprolyl cis-trans isomerase [Dictyostelium discoideum AX4]|eukprot:XP_638063.1 FKBP-type peptidylprolyl cis-trans isomerase [Dictyostelium discoideum AX4]
MNKFLIALLVLATLAVSFSQEIGVSILKTDTPKGECKGKTASIGDYISLKYVGKFEDGTVFDSSEIHGGFSFNFTIGERKVIPGLEIGTINICEGEKRSIKIPYQLAYGENGIENAIPPRTDIYFDLEVVSIEGAPAQPFYYQLIPSVGTIIAFSMLAGFIVLVKFIIKRYPDESNSKKPAPGKPKKTKAAKQN